MTTADEGHLEMRDLTTEEREAAGKCGNWLHTARFRKLGDFEVCDDLAGLEAASRNFDTKFKSSHTVGHRNTSDRHKD